MKKRILSGVCRGKMDLPQFNMLITIIKQLKTKTKLELELKNKLELELNQIIMIISQFYYQYGS